MLLFTSLKSESLSIDEQGLPKWPGVSHVQEYVNNFSDRAPLHEVVSSLWTDITSDPPGNVNVVSSFW